MKSKTPLILLGIIMTVGTVGLLSWLEDSEAKATKSDISPTDMKVEYWRETIGEHGGVVAYKMFADTYSSFDYNQQHTYAHEFGEALYNIEGVPGVTVCDSRFGFGCYHSFFGFALLGNGLPIISELDEACIAVYGEKGLGCQHGIGHGVLAELGYDELTKSLEACRTLDWQGPIGGCTSGVFMEYNFSTMSDVQDTRQPEAGDEYYPCTAVSEQFQEGCYFEQPAWWIARSDHDYGWTGDLCEELTGVSNKEACYRGAGNVIAGTNGYTIPEIQLACSEMPNEEGEMLCIEGATWIVSAQPQFEDVWRDLCEPFSGEYYDRCIASQDFI